MNTAHLHLMLNHLPVLGTGFGLLLLVAGLLRKSEDLKRASLATFVLSALLAVPVFLTGEPASDVVERLPGVSEALIEAHEVAAKLSLVIIEVAGMGALAALLILRWKPKYARWSLPGVLALSLLAGGSLLHTANLGGQIRHSEIRGTAALAAGSANQPTATLEAGGDEGKDED